MSKAHSQVLDSNHSMFHKNMLTNPKQTNAGGFSWKTLSFGIPRSFQKWTFAFCGYANHGASSSLHFEECFCYRICFKAQIPSNPVNYKMHIETHYELFSGKKPFATIWNMQNQLYDVPGGFSLYTLGDPNSVPIHQFKAYDCGPKLLHSTFTYGEAKHKPFLCHKNHHNPVSQKILKHIPHTRLSINLTKDLKKTHHVLDIP